MLIIECNISDPQGKKYFSNHIHPARHLLRHIDLYSSFCTLVTRYIMLYKISQYEEVSFVNFLPYEILSGWRCRCTSITTVSF